MIKRKCRNFQLTMLFALIIFWILISTVIIIIITFLILRYFGIMDLNSFREPWIPISIMALACVVLGTIIAAVFSRVPLKPLRQICNAADQLAEGDFNARIELKGPVELQRLNTSFNHMAKELGSLELLRTDFVDNFSHEFKTPIVSIRGFAKMLKYEDLTKEEQEEYLDIIIGESERLTELATNVLNLSRIENQQIIGDKLTYNVSEQIRRVIALLEKKWILKGIEFSMECDEVYYHGNEELLKQVWINLIDNGIKFSPPGGQMNIAIREERLQMVVSITDQGCGMSDKMAVHVFDKFYQGDTSHSTKGNGLGLAIAKKIVQLHEGRIRIADTGEQGTTFEVWLPRTL